MFRGALRRIIVTVLIFGLALLPLAAQAAPAERSGRSPQVERTWSGWISWSGAAGWLAVLRGLIAPVWDKDSLPAEPVPSTPTSHLEGTGIDPHGAPKPVVP